MENVIGQIWGYVISFGVFSAMWCGVMMGISGLFSYTTGGEHRIKVGFKDD
jgi:hypothetical protein